jgi:hypothetical protein
MRITFFAGCSSAAVSGAVTPAAGRVSTDARLRVRPHTPALGFFAGPLKVRMYFKTACFSYT